MLQSKTPFFNTIFLIMKEIIVIVLIFLQVVILNAQNIRKIAVYDNNSSTSSGIIAVSDTTIYEYSWYYPAWLAFPNTGLIRKAGIPQIDEICSFDSGSGNPSGIYVISDTAVFVYNYYMAEWLPLKNAGLIRINDTVQLADISAYIETSSGTERIFVISDTSVFRYDWYMQTWYPLSNAGLSSKSDEPANDSDFLSAVFPNPVTSNSLITYTLPEKYHGSIRLSLFNSEGKFLKEIVNEQQKGGKHEIKLNADELGSGTYYFEILGDDFSHVKKMIVVE